VLLLSGRHKHTMRRLWLCVVLCGMSVAALDGDAPRVLPTAAVDSQPEPLRQSTDVSEAAVIGGGTESGQCRRVRQAFDRWQRARVRTMGLRARDIVAARRGVVEEMLLRHKCEGTAKHR
jgi:hypothetical protein